MVVAIGVPNSQADLTFNFQIIYVIATLFQLFGDPLLIYCITKTALHPLRANGAVRRDGLLAWCLAIFIGIGWASNVGGSAAQTAAVIELFNAQESGYYSTSNNYQNVTNLVTPWYLLNNALDFVAGLILLGVTIYSLRKCRQLQLDPQQRRMPMFMLVTVLIWLLHSTVDLITQTIQYLPSLGPYDFDYQLRYVNWLAVAISGTIFGVLLYIPIYAMFVPLFLRSSAMAYNNEAYSPQYQGVQTVQQSHDPRHAAHPVVPQEIGGRQQPQDTPQEMESAQSNGYGVSGGAQHGFDYRSAGIAS